MVGRIGASGAGEHVDTRGVSSRSLFAPPTRPDGARRAALLVALVPTMALLSPASAGVPREAAPRGGISLAATPPSSTVFAVAATAGPMAQVAPTPAPSAPTGLAEPRSHRNLGLPASVAAVFIAGVGWGLVRVRRVGPVENRGKPSGHRRTVAR